MASVPIKQISENVESICRNMGAYLYDIQYIKEGKNKVLRILIDTENGIGIDMCEKISREISAYLDEADLINEAYSLEVSSPGVERKLRLPKHFLAVLGKKISITLYAPVDGEKSFLGTLISYEDNTVVLNMGDKTYSFTSDKIADASLYFDVNEFLKSQNK